MRRSPGCTMRSAARTPRPYPPCSPRSSVICAGIPGYRPDRGRDGPRRPHSRAPLATPPPRHRTRRRRHRGALTACHQPHRVTGDGGRGCAQSFLELVFEDDDRYGGGHVGALITHLAGPGREANLVAGVAAVPAPGAELVDQFRVAQPAQKVRGAADDLRGAGPWCRRGSPGRRACHRVEPCHLHHEGPGTGKRRGPRVAGQKHHLPTGASGCRIHTSPVFGCRVRGSHKRDRRPPLVRWTTTVSASSPSRAAGGGRSNGVRPSLSSDFLLSATSCWSAGAGTPRDFWPRTRATNLLTCGEAQIPDVGPAASCAREPRGTAGLSC
jgi:hypothetical protein